MDNPKKVGLSLGRRSGGTPTRVPVAYLPRGEVGDKVHTYNVHFLTNDTYKDESVAVLFSCATDRSSGPQAVSQYSMKVVKETVNGSSGYFGPLSP